MKFISEQMIRIMERLSEMFPGSSYQSRLDAYLNTKGITDAAQLENYIRQFNSQKEGYLWKKLLTLSTKDWSVGQKSSLNIAKVNHLDIITEIFFNIATNYCFISKKDI